MRSPLDSAPAGAREAAVRWSGGALDDVALRDRVADLRVELDGLPEDALVGVRIGNQPAFLVTVLACLEARRAVLPIDPLWTATEWAYASARAGPTLLVETDDTPVGGRASWRLDPEGRLLARPPGPGRPALFDTRGVAVVHWSSGSTGRPQPMAIEPDALAFRIASTRQAFEIGPGDRVLAVVPLAHCHGLDCIALPTLSAGAELILLDPLAADPARVLAAVDRHGITHLSALPRFYTRLLEQAGSRRELGTLRRVLCGSAALHPDCAREFADVFGQRIRAGYGITEIGVVSLDREPEPGRFDSVGPVLPGIEGRIEEPDADGVGPLWLRSPGAARGYLGDDAATAERFVDGWLATHDLVRAGPDGALEIKGRTSRFINVNGAKVDPSEVEHAVEALPWVAGCAVAGVVDDVGIERVVAWVETHTDEVPPDRQGALRGGVAARLALFKIPTEILFVEALPRSPLGKVLYTRLPPPPQPGGRVTEPRAEPHAEPRAQAFVHAQAATNETERRVADLWCEVLGLDEVGVGVDFFACGGDSLRLVQLHAALRDRLGATLQLVDLFRHPTVRAQAAALSGARSSAVDEALRRASRQRAARDRRPGAGPARPR